MTTLATDDFNRADGGLGANYTTLSGFAAPQISSNTAVDNAGADSAAIYSGVAIPDNHWAQCVRTGADGGGVILRGTSGAPSTFYVVNIEGTFGASAHLVFGEFSGASFTSNSDQVITFNSGDTLYAEAQGSSLLAKRNGSALGSGVTDSTYTTGDPGLFGFTGYVADDFAAGDFAASGATATRNYPRFPNKGRSRKAYAPYQVGFRQGIAAFAGAIFTQDVSGTLTSSATLLKLTSTLKAGTLTSAAALLKLTTHTFAGTLTSAGALLKQAQKVLSGAIASSATLTSVKVALKALTGTLTSSGALTKQTGKVLAGAIASAATLLRSTSKVLAGTAASSGALIKRTSKAFTGAIASSSALTSIRVFLRAFTGAIASSGALVRLPNKALGGTVAPSGTLARRTSKVVSGAIAAAGAITKLISRTLSGVLSFAGALAAFAGFVQVTTRIFTARVETLRFRAEKEQRRFVADTERGKFEAK